MNMRKILCILLAALLLTACGSEVAEISGSTTTEPPSDTFQSDAELTDPTEPTETFLPLSFDLEELRQNLPIMDGSTSLIPLEASIRAALFDITIEEATRDVVHSTTWSSFYNLLDGSVDLIFSCNLSEDQILTAKEENVELELVPIAREGFIFVVNAENPVDNLSQEQLRDIYTGKITNWKEVGGLDEEIIPYQRNYTSGSQNYMRAFMEGYELMDAPSEMRPDSMAGLLDVIAVNDHSRGSIGYSVYAYAANMYGNGNEIKFLNIDSVAPSKTTFADGSYPLLGENFAVFRADEPANSPVRKLVEWCQSYDGQLAIAKAGYVTIRDIGFNYEEMHLEKYEGTGTGPVAGETPTITYNLTINAVDVISDIVTIGDGIQSYRLYGLKDTTLLNEINAFIDEQMITWAWDAAQTVERRVDALNNKKELGYEEFVKGLWEFQFTKLPVNLDVRCSNGFFSVAVAVGYTWAVQEGRCCYYRTETATWDLLTGQRLAREDLFCRGIDIAEVLTNHLRVASQSTLKPYSDFRPDLKAEFASLPATGWHLTHEGIYFDEDNPYFSHGYYFDLSSLPTGTLSAQQSRDFTSALEENGGLQCSAGLNITNLDYTYAYNQDKFMSCPFPNEALYPAVKKINEQVMNYLNQYYTKDAIYNEFATQSTSEPIIPTTDWNAYCLADRYILFSGCTPECYLSHDNWLQYSKRAYLLFDMESGEQIDTVTLLKEGWRDAITEISGPYGVSVDAFDPWSIDYVELWHPNYQELTLFTSNSLGNWHFKIPLDYIIFP